jgi:outer membrane protein assembly factor BamB
MKLKKKFKFSDGFQVWRIKITDTDKLFIETRDTEKMKAYFHCYDLLSGKKIFSEFMMNEIFWLGIEAIKGDIVFFHRYAKPDMPGHRGIFAFDINTQKVLWEDESYAFSFIKNDLIYVFKEQFEGRYYYTLNIETGEIVDDLGEVSEEIKILRDEAELMIDYSNYNFPERYLASEIDKIDEIISKETANVEIASSVDYVIYDDLLMFNYHQIVGRKELTNKLKAFDLSKGKEIYSEVLNKSANAYAPDSFFLYKNVAIILKEKKEVIILEIKN